MRKFIILILIITISFFRMGIISRADTEIIYYNLQWTNNVSWDLETGVFDPLDYRYTVSNRLEIKDYFDMVWVDNTNFHHLLLFDGSNRLIGYYNSVYTNIQTSKYLGVYNTGITLPANAKRFAFMNYTGSNEVEIPQLDNNTLNEIFNAKILQDYIMYDLSYTNKSNTAANNYYWRVSGGELLFYKYRTSSSNILQMSFTITSNLPSFTPYNSVTSIYYRVVFNEFIFNNLENYPGFWFGRNTGVNVVVMGNLSNTNITDAPSGYYFSTYNQWIIGTIDFRPQTSMPLNVDYSVFDEFGYYNVSKMKTDQLYSPLYQTTFNNLSSLQIDTQLDLWFDNPLEVLGIQLPQAVIDEYQLLYEYNKTQTNYTQIFTPEVYEEINPFYYRYFDPNEPPREPFSFTTFINNMFNINGFDGSLIQMIISAVIIGGALFVMAMYKASGLLMIIVGVITYTGLAIIGWLPQAPILIMALGLAALIIIKLVKGGGGSDEE